MNQDDEHILNQIRAFANAPGAYVLLKGKKFVKWKESQSWIVQASLMDKEET